MDKTVTILDDICLAMGMIAEGCRTLGLISEGEYALIRPAKTESMSIIFIYRNDNPSGGATSTLPKRNENVTAYLSVALINLITPEIDKHRSRLAVWDYRSQEPVPWWSLSFDKVTGAVVEDEVFALCVRAAPVFKELAASI